jgi:glutamate/tyrosine decarboxylase-like PLP-dependent enzyme
MSDGWADGGDRTAEMHHSGALAKLSASSELLGRALELAEAYRGTLMGRQPGAVASATAVKQALDMPLPVRGTAPEAVLDDLAAAVEPGLVTSAGPRWFAFVTGGSLPVAVAADWLTSAWDQNAGLVALSPAAAAAEEVVRDWLRDLLDLPGETSIGLVTGGQMAHVTALAAARHALLGLAGHDVERDGLWGAPRINVIVGEEAHATVYAALRLLGMGAEAHRSVGVDHQGRMRPDELRTALAGCPGPTLICAQAGNVATGAFDPFDEIADAAQEHGRCWIHVDGAFGLWARATPSRRHLTAGVERADSWTIDAHKWLNVPYDCGIAAVRDRVAHTAAMTLRAPYLTHGAPADADNPTDYVPEASRRARGFVLYATLRALGRDGVADIVDRCCRHALTIRDTLAAEPDIEVLNDVVLNQVLVRFAASDPGAADARTEAVIARIQRDAVCWVGGTTWRGVRAMRISVVNWSTRDDDVEQSVRSIITAASAEAAA